MSEDAADLIEQYIREDPEWPGPAEARIAGYGVPVWALIGYYRVVNADLSRVATDYDLPEDAVRAALAYYRRHQEEIDARLLANA